MDAVRWSHVDSPLGPLLVAARGGALCRIAFPRDGAPAAAEPGWVADDRGLGAARLQLAEYFAGRRRRFELELDADGTPFQLAVWREVAAIPFGATASYGEIAARIGRPGASRAVGAANGANPLPIVVPCHRVLGADGTLTGFGGGLEAKRALLSHEGVPGFAPRLFG